MFERNFVWPGRRPLAALLCGLLAVASVQPVKTWGDISADTLRRLQNAQTGADLDQSELAAAWREVAAADIEDLPVLLAAFDDASQVGVNWLSSALDEVLQRAQARDKMPTSDQLASFLLNVNNGPRGRETALELLLDVDAEAAGQATKQLLGDPVARLRRPAVEALIAEAKEQADPDQQLSLYQRAFAAALDEDHVVACAVALRELDHPVDHIRKFGFVMHWQIIGPFDYEDGEGFERAYAPESLTLDNYDAENGIFSDAKHDGRDEPVAWQSHVTTARNGVVDLNKALGELRDTVAYAATVFESETEQDVEIRLRQQNSSKLWLNGKLVFSQPIGHTGNFFDQYTVPAKLNKGPNLIVVKSCQWPGPAEHPFLKNWQFGLRVSDATGNAILAANRPPTPELDSLPSQKPNEESSEDEEPASDDSADAKSAAGVNSKTKQAETEDNR